MNLCILPFAIVCLSASALAQAPQPPACTVGTNVYYIAQSGSDSNTQTQAKAKTTPWQHAPYMHSFTGTYTHTSGDCFVFRGGDTWVSTDYFVIANGGSSTAPDYYGVDQTWFTGSAWNRPIFDIGGGFPNTDAFHNSNVILLNAAWVTFDYWEIIHGACAATPTQTNQTYFAINGKSGISVTNSYFHAFEAQSGGCGSGTVSGGVASGNGFGIWIYMTNSAESTGGAFSNNVVDGTDGTGAQGYDTIVMDPANIDIATYNVVHDVCSAFGGNFTLAHDNAIYNFGNNVSQFNCWTQGIHAHAIRSNNDATVYNNLIHDVNDGAIALNPANGCPGGGSYVFNNIEWGFDADAHAPTYGIQTGDSGSTTTGCVYVSNNTIRCNASANADQCFRLENGLATVVLSNEHHITTTGGSGVCLTHSPFTGCGTATNLTYSAGNNLYQTTAAATSAGYTATQAYPYSPTTATSPTVGIGANNSSTWPSGISTNDTTIGCYEGTASGVTESLCPARRSIPRVPTWNAGAYQFLATLGLPAFHLNVLESPGNQLQTFWTNANGVTGTLLTPSNPYVNGVTLQVWDSDFDPITVGSISVTHGSPSFSLSCNNAHDDTWDGCNALAGITGILVTNGSSILWYELSAAMTCTGLNCTGTFTTNYAGTTNASASFNAYNFKFVDGMIAQPTAAGKEVDFAGPQWVSFSASATCPSVSGNNSTNSPSTYTLPSGNFAGSSSVAGNCGASAKLWNLLTLQTNYIQCESSSTYNFTPDWLDSTFQTYFKAAAWALVAHYSSYSNVRYVRISNGHGGETLPSNVWTTDTSVPGGGQTISCVQFWANVLNGGTINVNNQLTGSSPGWVNGWLTPIYNWESNTMRAGIVSQLGWAPQVQTGLTPAGSPNTLLPDTAAPHAVANNVAFGSQGLEASDVNNCSGATGDWCNLFGTYKGQVWPLELQTLNQSCPPGISCTGQQASTGPLPPLISFAVANRANYLEIYYQDWLLAFSSTYCATIYTTGQCNVITPAYLSAFEGNATRWGSGTGSGAFTLNATNCGPQSYSCGLVQSNAQLTTIPLSTTPSFGNLTGAGIVQTPADFGTRIVRCTDVNTGGSVISPALASYDIVAGGELVPLFSTDDTFLTVTATNSGYAITVGFNPSTLQCTTAIPGSKIAGNYAWSWATPKLLYANTGGTIVSNYDFTSANTTTPPVVSTNFDFQTVGNHVSGFPSQTSGPDWQASTTYALKQVIMPLLNNSGGYFYRVTTAGTSGLTGSEPNWQTGCVTTCTDNTVVWTRSGTTNLTWTSLFGVSAVQSGGSFTSDDVLTTGLSYYTDGQGAGQGTGQWVVSYRPSTGDWAVWNTYTCAINWSLGGVLGSGTASNCYPFLLHDVGSSVGGTITAAIGSCPSCGGAPGPFFWTPFTTTVNLVPTLHGGGHSANGINNFANLVLSPATWLRPFSNVNGGSLLSTATGVTYPSPSETHMGWPNTINDTQPIWVTHVAQGVPCIAGITSPLYCEIFGIITSGPNQGKYLREFHHFSSALESSWNFDVFNVTSAISRDGKFIAFGSDMMNTLGNTNGTSSSCQPGGVAWSATATYSLGYTVYGTANNPNGDVFQVTTLASTTPGSTQPTWSTSCGTQGNACTDSNGNVLTNLGVPSCRGDVFIGVLK